MIALSSTADVISAMQHARDVSLTAYTLPPGPVLDALTTAAKAGAHVRVRLEGYIYNDGDGDVSAANARAISQLSDAGADAKVVHPRADDTDAMLHLKAAVIDDTLFLDDRNWPADGADTIVRDSFHHDAAMVRDALDGKGDAPTSFFAVRKRDALASEARLLNGAQKGEDVIVETESLGARNRVYTALDEAAKRGAHIRLLVSSHDLENNPHERAVLAQLEKDGVRARVCDGDEKFAVVSGARGWIGSANASAAFESPDQLDWGLRTDNPAILRHVTAAFESRWSLSSRGESRTD